MELALIHAIQSIANPFLDALMQLFTMLAEPVFLVLVFTAIYWSIDKRQGELLAYLSSFSLVLNGLVKDLVRAPRPIGAPGVRTLRAKTAPGYSFPSAHTQSAATFYTTLALAPVPPRRRLILRCLCAFVVLMVGFSRIYLGVHWPRDVVVGLVLGVAVTMGVRALFLKTTRLPLLYLATSAVLCLSLFFAHSDDLFQSVGCMLGFTAAALFERRFVGFSTAVSRPVKLFRWLAGLPLLGAVYAGLKAFLPPGGYFYLLTYAGVIFWGMGVYPLLFQFVEGRWTARQKKARR